MYPTIYFEFSCLITPIQSELEHRVTKAAFARTNRKEYVKQVARIERRQARIRRIKAKQRESKEPDLEKVASSPESSYVVGKSQDLPIDLVPFSERYSRDPALKVLPSIVTVDKN